MSVLTQLLAVQQLDTAGDQARHRRSHHPARTELHQSESELVAVQRSLDQATQERSSLESRQAALEHEVAALDVKRAQVAKKLATGTIPKELQALSDEADSLARHQGHLEDQVLELMELAEPVDARIAELTAARAAQDDRAAAARVTIAEVESSCDAELVDIARRRAEAATGLDASLLTRYETMRKKLGGIAVAQLVHGTCTGCNLQIPATELEEIKAQPPDALVQCEQCGRLLAR
jgi:uncharacterized protein